MVVQGKGVTEVVGSVSDQRTEQGANKDRRREEQRGDDELETRGGVEFKGSTGEIGKAIFEKTYEYWPRHFTTAEKDQRHSRSQHMNKRKDYGFNSKKRVSFVDHKPSPPREQRREQ